MPSVPAQGDPLYYPSLPIRVYLSESIAEQTSPAQGVHTLNSTHGAPRPEFWLMERGSGANREREPRQQENKI